MRTSSDDWDDFVPSPDLPPLNLAEIDAECQARPGQDLIDRLDTVCYSALQNPLAGLTYVSDVGPYGL